ncbi:hypothetical protein F2P81_018978 [Scophthalmus maximus]|uniref:Uncharacterized protein n=1 Tax=Scophthalmus maximus TaxID=52904 RepID=A0A6A4S639_SCOMX|nr:hypothetical protein F2P81_018978 [Scophthalmus maximus]
MRKNHSAIPLIRVTELLSPKDVHVYVRLAAQLIRTEPMLLSDFALIGATDKKMSCTQRSFFLPDIPN